MSYWSWDASLSVGINLIDEQHRRIVDYINELDLAHIENDKERISKVLIGLADYTSTHFDFEEDLMERSGYPLSDTHKKVHRSFVAQIDSYVEQHENGKDITRRLMSDLKIWLTNHIKNDDKDYSPYVRKEMTKHQGWISRTVHRLFK
ncbi:bacteriohemerythrin [Microbulbifer sp. JMSA003]|uniref:bacteriohemerythrin n=1 Tax=Microbulbifer sp. JMSA003 TaxID=3243369 RepID=UPI004039C56E